MGNIGHKSKTEKSRVRGQGLTQAITKAKHLSCGVKGCWDAKPGMSSYIPSSKKEGEQGPGDFCAHFHSLNQNAGAQEADKLQLACVSSCIVIGIIVCLVDLGYQLRHIELG